MLTVSFCLIAAAFVACIVSAIGKCPLWVAVLLLCVWALLTVLPR